MKIEGASRISFGRLIVSDTQQAIDISHSTDLAFGKVDVQYSDGGVAIVNSSDIRFDELHVTGKVPPELAQSARNDVLANPSISAKEIASKYGDRLKPAGVDLDAWVARGANAASIVALLLQLAGLGGPTG
ncbi:hypothetical protein Bresu_0055 [Brevundimonas subvibrioides ATCC 15264]|uniref:Uncharacterized protein n=1 Tax=Brevundimonas subvibrioides (strain ATCC 15264 / DSM 4735 / LMG 14903 / NBRC 16000 / CB 81) TaxID=633149 RepID=D9QHU5_BRESC|nr:hypothetical protein Bresu_0055 [Brevundimonas subvibrioides ATCC 15264]